jgi:ATP-binding cassette subfamily B protein
MPLDAERADKAVKFSGFAAKLSTLPNGYDTQISREFDNDGVLLSGGEAQSLVIARALYRDSPVIILDEPSSALDPMAEYNLNKTMMELGRDKTVITISHRLSTTRMADKIYMLEKGEIIEAGTHNELMRLGGKYAEMFNLQAEKYRVSG